MPKEDVEAADEAPGKNVIKPSAKFNNRHVVYLLCRDAIPGMVISAAINMAISYGEIYTAFCFPALF